MEQTVIRVDQVGSVVFRNGDDLVVVRSDLVYVLTVGVSEVKIQRVQLERLTIWLRPFHHQRRQHLQGRLDEKLGTGKENNDGQHKHNDNYKHMGQCID